MKPVLHKFYFRSLVWDKTCSKLLIKCSQLWKTTVHMDYKSIEEKTIWEEGGECNVSIIMWSDTSCASYTIHSSHILRASVHQKIHEQDVVFGKVLDSNF